ncbi:MAG: ATP synthase F1 subunit delta [Planctomycetota bacterium]|jgi:F-type H+-transporting ATPase subunit delta|nr:ATP synthase F1 subunit delta [Planctomycetota bacterium]
MSREGMLARRYAKALFKQAEDGVGIEPLREDLSRLADLFIPGGGQVPEFPAFLASRIHTARQKLDLAGTVLERLEIAGAAGDFLKVLIRHGRTELLPRAALEFAKLADAAGGGLTAVAHTARPIGPEQAERLVQALSRALGVKVGLRQMLEPGLLAGARITVGDKTFDGSVLGRLESLRRRLAAPAAP